jgi:FlaA1/EpsC-like NDP-sugar epimerase
MEANVHEAVKNNVFSLLSLLEIAEEQFCKSFVLISSDKAVRPTSVMGVTKRVGELILSCKPANHMQCVAVRFGNVLGSSGSVVCVLKEQLRNNQPLTVTHPEIRRFFMTSREAVSLVLEAFATGAPGDILVLDMGESVRIATLARTLAELSAKSDAQPNIQFTGLRPGEKLYEELFYPTEAVLPTASQKVKRARGAPLEWSTLAYQLEVLRLADYRWSNACPSAAQTDRARVFVSCVRPSDKYSSHFFNRRIAPRPRQYRDVKRKPRQGAVKETGLRRLLTRAARRVERPLTFCYSAVLPLGSPFAA